MADAAHAVTVAALLAASAVSVRADDRCDVAAAASAAAVTAAAATAASGETALALMNVLVVTISEPP